MHVGQQMKFRILEHEFDSTLFVSSSLTAFVCCPIKLHFQLIINRHIYWYNFILVLDMARHVPLFVSLMEILRALVTRKCLIPLLLPKIVETGASAGPSGSISQLLSRLKDCADTYIKRLKYV